MREIMDTTSLLDEKYDRSKFTQANSEIWENLQLLKANLLEITEKY